MHLQDNYLNVPNGTFESKISHGRGYNSDSESGRRLMSQERRQFHADNHNSNTKSTHNRVESLTTRRPFKLNPLKHPKDEIRLVNVLPWSFSDYEVRCELWVMKRSVAAQKRYRALSYRWGDGERQLEIVVNDETYQVHQNLYDFLKHASRMRFEEQPGWRRGLYWIDALCINQENSPPREEKLIQLQYMSDVYSSAYGTYIWLGADSDTARRLGRIQAEHKALYQTHDGCVSGGNSSEASDASGDDENGRNEEKTSNCTSIDVRRKLQNEDTNISRKELKLIKTLIGIMHNPYWKRLWILQEIAVSDRRRAQSNPDKDTVRVICGPHEVGWRYMLASFIAMRVKVARNGTLKKYEKLMTRHQGLWLICVLYASEHRFPSPVPGVRASMPYRLELPLLIYLSRNSIATQGQDYVYALLGLVQEGWGNTVTTQKQKSGCEIICRVIRRMTYVVMERMIAEPGVNHTQTLKKMTSFVGQAIHKPLDKTPKQASIRKKCCGVANHQQDPLYEHSCNALEICRRMACAEYGTMPGLLWLQYGNVNIPQQCGELVVSGTTIAFGKDNFRLDITRQVLREAYERWIEHE